MRPVFRFVERLLLGFGVGALVYSISTLAYSQMVQRFELRQFEQQVESANPVSPAGERLQRVDGSVDVELRYATGPRVDIRPGDTVGKLEVPRLGISVMVHHGVETSTLDVAAGHVPGTPLPGSTGKTAIAAHRDTFFRKLEDIRDDDLITFSNWYGIFTYQVESIEIVGPGETRVLESRARPELTLITCYPFYFVGSAPDRFVVHARLLSPPIAEE